MDRREFVKILSVLTVCGSNGTYLDLEFYCRGPEKKKPLFVSVPKTIFNPKG